MADSDDTTTLPALSRRELLGATVLPIGTADARRRGSTSDPVLDLWEEWRILHAELDAWQDDWQKKEGVLLRTVGVPRVLVPVPGQAEPVSACEPAEIGELLEDLPGTEELRERLHREFAAHRRRWEIAAGAIGLGPVEERVNHAWERWDALTVTLPKPLKEALDLYAAEHGRLYGPVDATALVPYMLEAFIRSDRTFMQLQGKAAGSRKTGHLPSLL